MSEKGNKLKKKQKSRLKRIFIKAIVMTLVALVAVGIAAAVIYNKYLYNGTGGIGEKKDQDPINKTVAVFGVDEDGYRTDVIFVVNFNSQTGKTRIISIPRDTRVEWSEAMQDKLRAINGRSISVSKINEMTSYAGIENISQFTIPEIEDLLGIQIDNYVIVTIDAFKQIVDAIGGVEVDVPVLNGNGLQYDDNAQNLHIHLDPGLQTLDGEQAEGLVRFRKGYVEGDVGRIRTQQLFLEAFAKKVTSPQILTKLPNIAKTVMQNVTTDVKLSEALGYIPYLNGLKTEQLKCEIIPGEGGYQGAKSYFIVDEEAMPGFMNEVLYGDDHNSSESVVDKTVSLEVLNSTSTSGLAGQAKVKLEENGYTVSNIGNYTEDTLNTTVIYAKDTALATQFLTYYPNAVIKQSSDITFDIQIVLGNDSIG